jgi:hypothetical protein
MTSKISGQPCSAHLLLAEASGQSSELWRLRALAVQLAGVQTEEEADADTELTA